MGRTVDVHYLGHSGFAVDTGVKVLVFDYWETANQLIKAVAGSEERKLFFFSSHNHHDHYDRSIEKYKREAGYLGHFAGWNRPGGDLIYVTPHTWTELGGTRVYSLVSNDTGAAFLVSADGLNIFHGGDLAGWEDETSESFDREIDHIKDTGIRIDIAFLAVTTFSGVIQESMRKAAGYFLDTLDPTVFMPMHGNSREYLYKEFKENGYKDDERVICPEYPGQKISLSFA